MREIKFRAWDGEVMGEISYMKFPVSDALPVMQYTGTRDRNNKEIYEGDIVRVQHMLVETIPPYEAVIEWDKWRFAIRRLNPDVVHSGFFLLTNLDPFGLDLEVIGNIHENPELLEIE